MTVLGEGLQFSVGVSQAEFPLPFVFRRLIEGMKGTEGTETMTEDRFVKKHLRGVFPQVITQGRGALTKTFPLAQGVGDGFRFRLPLESCTKPNH